MVITATGDVYHRQAIGECNTPMNGAPEYWGNFLGGTGPVKAQQGSWGQLKARYR